MLPHNSLFLTLFVPSWLVPSLSRSIVAWASYPNLVADGHMSSIFLSSDNSTDVVPTKKKKFISFSSSSTRSSTFKKLQHRYYRTTANRHFYFNRIVLLWNKLPPIDTSNSYKSIKKFLLSFFWQYFLEHFDDNSCTFHIICPCSQCYSSFRQ